MQTDAFLADDAENVNGKLYALGIGWDHLAAASFPLVHPRMSIGIVISVPYTATNQVHELTVHLEDEDGGQITLNRGQVDAGAAVEPLMMFAGQFTLGRPPLLPAGDDQKVVLAFRIDGLVLDHPGMYSWVISIDGNPEKRLSMRAGLIAG